MNLFEYGWIGFALYFASLEGYALWLNSRQKIGESKKRRTLSSIIWTLGGTIPGTRPNTGVWVRRSILGLALLWLNIHFLTGGQIV